MIECPHNQLEVREMLFFAFKLLITALVAYLWWHIYSLVTHGRALARQPSPQMKDHLVFEKKDTFSKMMCLLVIAIICIEVVVRTSPRAYPPLFPAHLGAAILFLFLIVIMRFQTGLRSPTFHRWAGYAATILFAFITITGGWFLWS